jgi:outer membrane protein TolC
MMCRDRRRPARPFHHFRRWCAVAIVIACPAAGWAQATAAPDPPAPLTLDQALQYAREHYPTVRAALELVSASTANVSVARAASLPRFDSIWQTNRATTNNVFGQLLPQSVLSSISGPVLTTASSHGVWGTAVGGLFSWEPFDFGLRDAVVGEAEAGVARARAEEGLTQLAVQGAVGVAFLGVVNARQAQTTADADVLRRQVLARAARTLADNQLRPGAEASRAEAELAAARTRSIQARQALTLAEITLGRVLGMSGGPVAVNATRLLDSVTPAPPSSTPVPAHPLVQFERATVDLARAREGVIANSDRPRIYLQSSVMARGSGANPDGSFDGGASGLGLDRANWAAGVQVVFPNLFGFGTLRARQDSAGALVRAESARYDEAVLTVTSQQRAAAATLEAARAIAQNTPVQLSAAQQGEAQARARYNAGLAGITEVAETQNLLAAAEYQDAVARVDVWRALLAQAVAQGSLAAFIELIRAAGQ